MRSLARDWIWYTRNHLDRNACKPSLPRVKALSYHITCAHWQGLVKNIRCNQDLFVVVADSHMLSTFICIADTVRPVYCSERSYLNMSKTRGCAFKAIDTEGRFHCSALLDFLQHRLKANPPEKKTSLQDPTISMGRSIST